MALRDFEAYYAAGSTWHYHGDPYGRDIWRAERVIPGVVPAREELLPFVGPPFGLPLWDALSRLPWPLATGVWHAVMILSFAAVVLGSVKLASGKIAFFDACAALVAGAAFAPLTSGAALGQVALPACAAVILTPLLLRVRFAYAAALGALVAALQPNLALALAARLREPRSWIAAAAALALAVGGSMVAMQGLGGIGHYLGLLQAHSDAERDAAIQTTLAAVVRGFGLAPGAAAIAGDVATALVAIGLGAQWLSRRYAPDDLLVLACAALPIALPFAHEHDFNVAFLPAVAIAYRTSGITRALATVSAIAISVDWLGLAQRPGSTLEACAFAAAMGLALTTLVTRNDPERRGAGAGWPGSLAVTVGSALCIALVAIPSVHHVLPTWPDRLPAGFSEPRTIPAPDVWHAEQAASGITALDPYWAVLRIFSLAGCALLWAAGSVALSGSGRSEPLSTPSRPRVGVRPSV